MASTSLGLLLFLEHVTCKLKGTFELEQLLKFAMQREDKPNKINHHFSHHCKKGVAAEEIRQQISNGHQQQKTLPRALWRPRNLHSWI